MALRKIIRIDEKLCDGCGECITSCSEGALRLVGGKARLVKEDYCDGFGDCVGACPTGALTIEERMAGEFDYEATRAHVAREGGMEAVRKLEVGTIFGYHASPLGADAAPQDWQRSGGAGVAMPRHPGSTALTAAGIPRFRGSVSSREALSRLGVPFSRPS